MGTDERTIVVVAGSRWTDTPGTDHRLARALADHANVLWVDPASPYGSDASLRAWYGVDIVAQRIRRLRTTGPPGFTRPVIRRLTSFLVGRSVRAALADDNASVRATILMSGRDRFLAGVGGLRILHVTDDWPAGAGLMGLSRRAVQRNLRSNIMRANMVTAVSPALAADLASLGASRVNVLANGCPPPSDDEPQARRPVAGLLGQLNERLDVDLLDALADKFDVEVVGPVTARDPGTVHRLNRFLHAGRVTWFGRMTDQAARRLMSTWAVGLTPYKVDDFNRSSFPLKTLEYLSAGLPTVSTDLPASRWLDCEWVQVATTHEDFVRFVDGELAAPGRPEDVLARRRIAADHTWTARAEALLSYTEAFQ